MIEPWKQASTLWSSGYSQEALTVIGRLVGEPEEAA